MLVLSRKQTESICINDNVVVTVLSIRGSRVKIGIEAPRETPVHRKEVCERFEEAGVAGFVVERVKGKSA